MDATEPRRTGRHLAGENRVGLLRDGGPDMRESPGCLADVGDDGARFVADMPPPPGHDVRSRVGSPRRPAWVPARVVRLDVSTGGLSFAGDPPQDLVACVARRPSAPGADHRR